MASFSDLVLPMIRRGAVAGRSAGGDRTRPGANKGADGPAPGAGASGIHGEVSEAGEQQPLHDAFSVRSIAHQPKTCFQLLVVMMLYF